MLAYLYLDALDRELQNRGLCFCRYADDCNVYVGSEAAAKRVLAGIGDWIEKHLRWRVNRTKSGVGRPWERKFLGFRINRQGQREVAPQSVERGQQKVREIWRANRSVTSGGGTWSAGGDMTGWPRSVGRSFGWKVGYGVTGGSAFGRVGMECEAARERYGGWGVGERLIQRVPTRRGAWFMARNALLHRGLSKATLKRYGLVEPSDLAACG